MKTLVTIIIFCYNHEYIENCVKSIYLQIYNKAFITFKEGKMDNYLFFFRHVTIGGAELLIEKIARQLLKNGNNACVVCEEIIDNTKNRYNSIKLNIILIKDWENYTEVKKYIKSYDTICVTFEWDIFLDIYSICSSNIKRTVFYAICDNILGLKYRNISIIRKLERKIMSNALLTMLENQNVIFMDEQTVRFTKKYYSDIQYKNQKFEIIRIPVDSFSPKRIKKKKNIFRILSVARADFPFKGYLIGLIKFMEQIDDDVYLDIVSYGKDFGELMKVYNEEPQNVKYRIFIHGKKDNTELQALYRNADLYIGQGTTVVEAAMNGTISIPVVPRTMELIGTHFFYENFRDVAIDDTVNNKIMDLYLRVRKMTEEELEQIQTQSYELAFQNYSTEIVAMQFIKFCKNVQEDRNEIRIKMAHIYRTLVRKIKKLKLNEKKGI